MDTTYNFSSFGAQAVRKDTATKVNRRNRKGFFMSLKFDVNLGVGPKRAIKIDDVAIGISHFNTIEF